MFYLQIIRMIWTSELEDALFLTLFFSCWVICPGNWKSIFRAFLNLRNRESTVPVSHKWETTGYQGNHCWKLRPDSGIPSSLLLEGGSFCWAKRGHWEVLNLAWSVRPLVQREYVILQYIAYTLYNIKFNIWIVEELKEDIKILQSFLSPSFLPAECHGIFLL